MSELVKTFVFDLQRFAAPTPTTDTSAAIKTTAQTVNTNVTLPDDGAAKSTYTTITDGAYYWATANDVITAASATFKASTVKKYVYTTSDTPAENITIYTVALKDVTEITLDTSTTALKLGTAAQYGTFGDSPAGTVTLKNGAVTGITLTAGSFKTGADASVAGTYTINSKPITTAGAGFTYEVLNATTSDKTITTHANTTKVTATGDAAYVIPDSGAAELTIGTTKYTFTPKTGTAFTVANNAATGFIFGANDASITGTPTTLKSFKFYDTAANAAAGTTLDISLSDIKKGSTATITQAGANQYTITGFGATDAFTAGSGSNAVKVTFDTVKSGNTPGVTVDTSTGALVNVAAGVGDTFTVSGNGVKSGGAQGIAITQTDGTTSIDTVTTTKGGFTYTVGTGSADNTITLADADAAALTLGSQAVGTIIPAKSTSVKTLDANGKTFTFLNKSGSSKFTCASAKGTVDGIDFGAVGDSLTLTSDAKGLAVANLKYGGTAFGASTLALSGITTETAVLTWKEGTTFTVSGLVDQDVLTVATNLTVEYAEKGGTVDFDAKKGTLGAVTVLEGGKVTIGGAAFGKDVSINGQTINVNGTGLAATDSFTYDYTKKANPTLSVTGSATDLTITSPGNLKQINLPQFAAAAAVTIGKKTYTVTSGGTDSSLLLDGSGNVNGFVFGSTTASIVFKDGVPDGFKLYDTDTDTALTLPTITGDGVVSIAKTGTDAFSIVVGQGAVVTDSDGKEIDFSGLTKNDFATIVFDAKGVVSSVYAAADPTVSGGTAAPFANGASITVTGDKATEATEGLLITNATAATAVHTATASGNYAFSVDSTGALVLTLNEDSDTLYAAGAATKVELGGSEGTITYDSNAYKYTSGGRAYFTATAADGKLDGFVFYDDNDSINLTAEGLALSYYDPTGKTVTELTTAPKISNYPYTVEMLSGKTPEFQISEIPAEAAVQATGGTPTYFTFGKDATDTNNSIKFNATTVTALNIKTGTVEISSDGEALLASSETDSSKWFQLNGKPINIDAELEDTTLTYNATEKSLLGLADGSTIVNGGEITKIYAAMDEDQVYTFGADDSEVEFEVTSAATKDADRAFFTLAEGKVTGFTFMKEDDSIFLPAEGVPEDFKLYDTAGGEAITAPVVYEDDTKKTQVGITVVKGKENFSIEDFAEGNYVELGSTKLTFKAVVAGTDPVAVAFDSKGALVAINNVSEDGNQIKVDGATGEVKFDTEVVNITGSAFVYGRESGAATITDVAAKAVIKATAGASVVSSATDSTAAGAFTFGGDSKVVTLDGDIDGVKFFVDSKTAALTGISGITGTESVSGALNGLTFNGKTEKLDITDGTYTVFGGGLSLAGLKDGANVVKAGGVSDFLSTESGKFTILGGSMSIADDADGVVFKTDGASLTGIDSLAGFAIGNFTGGLSVNKVGVQVTGDEAIKVVGNNTGVTEIHELGGKGVAVVSASGASLVGANADGDFTFTFAGGASFALKGNKEVETTFTFENNAVTAIDGLDDGEIVAGSFSSAIKVAGKEIQVANDNDISIVGGTSSAILGLTGGASVVQSGGVKFAVTDSEGQFTFKNGAFSIAGDKEVTFVLDADGNVTGINGVADTATVSGALNGVAINEGDPFDIRDNTNYSYSPNTGVSGVVDTNTVQSANGASSVWVSGTDFTVQFSNGAFSVAGEKDGVNFLVKDKNIAIGVESLDAGATMSGDFTQLTTVNGVSFAVKDGDNSISIVGGDAGIAQILGLTAEGVIENAGGASLAKTDKAGKFTFGGASGVTFETADDDEVAFALTDGAVTAISELSGAVTGDFSNVTGINEKDFDVKDSDGVLTVYGNESEDDLSKIAGVTGDATIGEVGSVSQVITDSEGKFTFKNASWSLADGATEVTFGLSSSEVTSISNLKGSATGGFSGITVNGADIDITDGDGQLKVFGDGTKLTAIEDVDADAIITKAGGVEKLSVNGVGSYSFADSGEFKVAGDSSVTFLLNTDADAEVTGIENLSGNVTGDFSGMSSINGKTFDVVDADGGLTVYGDGSDITKITGVTGSASIGEVGSVSQILTDKAGEFAFTNGSFSVAGDDEVTFGMSASKVVSISELVGTVEGAFEDVTVNGQNFQISGDSSIALVGGASGVTAIEKLSGGADIVRAEGYLTAKTDSAGTFTFANGRTIQVLGDSSVVFGLNNGLVMSIDDLDETATIIGAINQIAINGSSSMFDVRNNANLWYSNGTLSAVVDGNTIVSADVATTVQVVTDGTYTFGNGAFQISGDQDGVAQFTVADSSIATAINGVDAGATVTGALNGMAINGGASLVVENDETFGAVAGASALAKLINLSDGANVVEAGGASQFVTDAEGQFTILGTAMQIESDDEVTFTADASGITAIDGLEGTAIGDFQNVIAVNTNEVQILNDSVVAVSSDGAEVTAIGQVSDGATVAAVGGAVEVGTDTEGSFTFAVAGDSQAFEVEGDDEVTFQLEDGVVTGVNELEEGKLTFDTNTTALTLNDDESFTIQTSTNASFSIADNSVNYVTGVDGAIDGLVNATVVATGAMEVNGTNIDVQGDEDFKVIVQDGDVVGLADISGGARVNVAGVSIAVDSNGDFEIGGKQYNFNDTIDGAFNLATGDESELSAVDAFDGAMIINQPADQSLTVNGGELEFASTADSVTVAASASGITAVDGLVSGDAVYGDLDSTAIAMPGAESSVRGEGSFLTVNDVTYELLNDADGIVVTGGREVTDLNEEASLYVSEKGKYTVNGNGSDIDVEDTNMPIIGLDGATDAYIYDPANLIIRKGTPVSAIEEMLGLPGEYETSFGGDDVKGETADTSDDPLDSAGLSSMFAEQDLDQPVEIFATNDTKEAQDIDLAGTDFSKKVHLFNGDQNVAFNNAGGNLAVVEEESSGVKNIALGDMGDAVIMKADAGDGSAVNVTGGAGDDSVVVQGSAPVNFDMSDGGADKVITFASSNARIALAGYDALANPNAGIHIAERWASLADAITAGLLNFANGVMSIGTDPNANAQIDLGAKNIVNLFNYLGQKQAVGFTNDAGGLVDASTAQDPVILIGNDKGQKSGDSTLLGGSGDDTAIAGGGDNIDLGEGNNEVRLQQYINRAGANVTLAQGRTSITGFIGSFNPDHGDVIKTDLSAANVSFDGENVYIEGDGFYGVIVDAITNGELSYDAADVVESADLVESADSSSKSLLAAQDGDYTNVLFDDDGAISKTAIAKTGGVFDVKLDFDARANNYVGDDSGITFYDHTGEVLVNLAEGAGSIDTEAVTYSGINKVAAGAGQTTMIGGESNETLIAGQGNDSVWGAGGKNLLLGYDDAGNDKTGQTSFFVVAEADGAANTVRGFNFVDDDSWNVNTNQITADVLDFQVQYDYVDTENGAVDVSGDDVVILVKNRNKESSESVIVEGARGKNFVVSGDGVVADVVAQVNTDNLTADKFANYFVATGKNATLTVGNDIDTANIYLDSKTPDGSDYLGDVPQFYGDIHVIDATGSNAKAELGGNAYDNTIMAGSGDASLWGGNGGNDLLVGGTGANTFFYNYGNGSDTIQGAHDGDIVDLTNVKLENLTAEITSTGVELTFKDGGSLTVNSTADVAYQVEGKTYVVNDDRDGWTTK